MSIISASTTTTTAYQVTADTTGTLVLKTGASPTTAVTIDASQNVGLGVTPSTWRLDVKSAGAGIATNGIRFNRSSTTTQYGVLNFEGAQFNNVVVNTAGTGCYWGVLYSTDGSTTTQPLTLDASGNLAVGTTSPSGILHVNGVQDGTAGKNARFSYNGTYYLELNEISIRAYNNPLIFGSGTSGAERARFNTVGDFLVGTTVASQADGTNFQFRSGFTQVSHVSGTASGSVYSYFVYGGTGIGTITQNGTTGVLYNTSSDYRLKDITGPVTGQEAKNFIMALQPKQGTWKADGSKFVGFLAHEFQEVSPSSVTGEKDAVDEEGNPVMQAMQASSPEVMANLVAFIQELNAKVEAQAAEIAQLKGAA